MNDSSFVCEKASLRNPPRNEPSCIFAKVSPVGDGACVDFKEDHYLGLVECRAVFDLIERKLHPIGSGLPIGGGLSLAIHSSSCSTKLASVCGNPCSELLSLNAFAHAEIPVTTLVACLEANPT